MSVSDKLSYLNTTKSQLLEAINAATGAALDSNSTFRSYTDPLWEQFIKQSLFGNSEQGVWYDPSDLSTLFQDSAGTTPVTADGQPVGLMLDKSGNDNHATQSVSAARPTYRTDGTLHWIEGDGVDDYLEILSGINDFTTDFFAIAAMQYDGGGGSQGGGMYFRGGSPSGGPYEWLLQPDSDTTGRVRFWADSTDAGTGVNYSFLNSGIQTPMIIGLNWDGTNIEYGSNTDYKTGVRTSNIESDGNTTKLFVYAGYGNFKYFGGVIRDGHVTDSERQKTEQYLAQKAGITL